MLDVKFCDIEVLTVIKICIFRCGNGFTVTVQIQFFLQSRCYYFQNLDVIFQNSRHKTQNGYYL